LRGTVAHRRGALHGGAARLSGDRHWWCGQAAKEPGGPAGERRGAGGVLGHGAGLGQRLSVEVVALVAAQRTWMMLVGSSKVLLGPTPA
jgi:hypothetical protein